MNKHKIIEMAREAGLRDCTCAGTKGCLERFAALVAEKEREAAEDRVVDLFTDMETPYLPDITRAIRARKT